MEIRRSFLILCALIEYSYQRKLPADIEKCSRTDPNLSKCALNAARQVMKDYKEGKLELFNFDPMNITAMETQAHSIFLALNDMTITGFKEMRFDKISIDLENNVWRLQVHVPYMYLNYKLHFVGRILLIDLDSSGLSNVTLSNADMDVSMKYDLKKHSKNNQSYIDINDLNCHFARIGGLHGHTNNLFPGNDAINEKMNEMFNSRWRIFLNQIQQPLEEAFGVVMKATVNQFFKQYSYEELFLK